MKVPDRPTQIGIWIYFWLLLLEGVFRKWITPQWSDAIFVIRDPVVIVIYLLAIRARAFPSRPAMVAVWVLTVLSLGFSVLGDSPFVVTLFGLRTNYLHLPLIFVIATVFDRNDIIRFGKWFLLLSIPIIALMIDQFNSPPDSWINVGAGASESGQLRGAMNHIRSPGPFSFVSGVVSYFALVLAFLIYGWTRRRVWHWSLLVLGSAATITAIPMSVSRSLLFAYLVVALFAVPVLLHDLRRIPNYVGPVVAIASFLLLEADSIYLRVFVTRWHEAEEAGGGNFYVNVILRILNEFTLPFRAALDAPLMGNGIGLGTIAGARLATGKYTFLLAESELARVVLELGPILGFAFIGWRVWLSGRLISGGWSKFMQTGDSLAWLLAAATFLSVLWGQWGPSTNLGFAVFGAGLTLAALNDPVDATANDAPDDAVDEESDAESDGSAGSDGSTQ